ncbi:M15 family metallopeptidase [Modestobacter sp. NPDC049651]|uniref:M15 family metallopeptidase n=1 Tax=unclassified Modestobacter TaxID=2643866 RepID=UPI0033F21A37
MSPASGSSRRQVRAQRARARRRRVVLLGVLLVAVLAATGALTTWGVRRGDAHSAETWYAARSAAPPAAPSTAPSSAPPSSAPSSAAPPPAAPVFDTAAHSTTDPASPWVVVNKQHPLQPLDFAPAQLATVGGKQVSAQAAPDLQAMIDAAAAEGLRVTVSSGYRSYAYQVGVHDEAVSRQGWEYAESVSARAGYSEHQTGFAVDLGSAGSPGCDLSSCFGGTPEGRWLAAHAAEFGFLLRYTAAGSAVTGYSPEAWHFRWVGRDLTAELVRRGVITLEEFFGISGGPEYAAP